MATTAAKTRRPSLEKKNKKQQQQQQKKKQLQQVRTNKQKSWWGTKWTEIYRTKNSFERASHFFNLVHFVATTVWPGKLSITRCYLFGTLKQSLRSLIKGTNTFSFSSDIICCRRHRSCHSSLKYSLIMLKSLQIFLATSHGKLRSYSTSPSSRGQPVYKEELPVSKLAY